MKQESHNTKQAEVKDEIERVLETPVMFEGAIQIPSDLLWNVADNMQATAGSFVRTLAELYIRADGHNQKKILRTFPEYFIQYAV